MLQRLEDIVEWKNLTVEKGYGHAPISAQEMYDWLMQYGLPFRDYITDTTVYLNRAERNGKKILFEAQLGALRDIDYGIYPYTCLLYTSRLVPIMKRAPDRMRLIFNIAMPCMPLTMR